MFLDTLHNVITPEMDHSVIESNHFMWITRIIDIISTTTIFIILFMQIYTAISFQRSYKRRTSLANVSDALGSWSKTLSILSFLFILSQFVLLLLFTFNIWEIIPTKFPCDIIVLSMVILYHLSKSIFYCILITRLQVAFCLSAVKYNDSTIMLLYLFVVIYTIFVCIGTPFIIFGVWLINPINWCHVHTHNTILSSISIGIWISLDVIISIILCYLFIRPLTRVTQLIEQNQPRFTAL
eukprot:UN07572